VDQATVPTNSEDPKYTTTDQPLPVEQWPAEKGSDEQGPVEKETNEKLPGSEPEAK
jgi:hypothetical protein